MQYYAVANDSDGYIQHFGIKGQKWGVRNYQNADGSLTAAGRKRYGVNKQDSPVNLNLSLDEYRYTKKHPNSKLNLKDSSSQSIEKYYEAQKKLQNNAKYNRMSLTRQVSKHIATGVTVTANLIGGAIGGGAIGMAGGMVLGIAQAAIMDKGVDLCTDIIYNFDKTMADAVGD